MNPPKNKPIEFEQANGHLGTRISNLYHFFSAGSPKIEIKKMEEDKSSEEEHHTDPPKVDTPSSIRVIACLKRKEDMKRFEETDECFILDFDPSESLEVSKLSLDDNDDDADLSVVAEMGPVACRDYPHSRHLCLKFPFSTTSHESCCEMCFCYVCDSVAPCKYWTQHLAPHCNADSSYYWKEQRNLRKVVGIAEEAR